MVEIENNSRHGLGDEVWWFDKWDNLKHGTIYDIRMEQIGNECVPCALIYESKGAYTGAKLSICWSSKQACLDAEAERVKLQIAEYKKAIKDVGDLVRFLLQNDINGEFPDREARKAAEERAVELGIDID